MVGGVETLPLAPNLLTKIVCPILTSFKDVEVLIVSAPEIQATTIALCNGHCHLVGNFAELP